MLLRGAASTAAAAPLAPALDDGAADVVVDVPQLDVLVQEVLQRIGLVVHRAAASMLGHTPVWSC